MMNTIGGLGLSANIMADKAQNKAQVEKAEALPRSCPRLRRILWMIQPIRKKLKDACRGFESMFMQMMWKEMRGTVPENALFGESHGEKIFKDMLDTEMVDRMSEAGGRRLGRYDVQAADSSVSGQRGYAERLGRSMEAKGQHIILPG